RRIRVPILSFGAKREVRAKQIGLVEVEPNAAIERRPARVYAGAARTAEEIELVVLRINARLFFRAVAVAEVDTLMVALGDGDAHRNLIELLLGRRRLTLIRPAPLAVLRRRRLPRPALRARQRLDVGELEQLHAVEAPLSILDDAATVEIAGLERQLPLDHAVA